MSVVVRIPSHLRQALDRKFSMVMGFSISVDGTCPICGTAKASNDHSFAPTSSMVDSNRLAMSSRDDATRRVEAKGENGKCLERRTLRKSRMWLWLVSVVFFWTAGRQRKNMKGFWLSFVVWF